LEWSEESKMKSNLTKIGSFAKGAALGGAMLSAILLTTPGNAKAIKNKRTGAWEEHYTAAQLQKVDPSKYTGNLAGMLDELKGGKKSIVCVYDPKTKNTDKTFHLIYGNDVFAESMGKKQVFGISKAIAESNNLKSDLNDKLNANPEDKAEAKEVVKKEPLTDAYIDNQWRQSQEHLASGGLAINSNEVIKAANGMRGSLGSLIEKAYNRMDSASMNKIYKKIVKELKSGSNVILETYKLGIDRIKRQTSTNSRTELTESQKKNLAAIKLELELENPSRAKITKFCQDEILYATDNNIKKVSELKQAYSAANSFLKHLKTIEGKKGLVSVYSNSLRTAKNKIERKIAKALEKNLEGDSTVKALYNDMKIAVREYSLGNPQAANKKTKQILVDIIKSFEKGYNQTPRDALGVFRETLDKKAKKYTSKDIFSIAGVDQAITLFEKLRVLRSVDKNKDADNFNNYNALALDIATNNEGKVPKDITKYPGLFGNHWGISSGYLGRFLSQSIPIVGVPGLESIDVKQDNGGAYLKAELAIFGQHADGGLHGIELALKGFYNQFADRTFEKDEFLGANGGVEVDIFGVLASHFLLNNSYVYGKLHAAGMIGTESYDVSKYAISDTKLGPVELSPAEVFQKNPVTYGASATADTLSSVVLELEAFQLSHA